MTPSAPPVSGRADVVTAPAKLTWTLTVTGVRADGYHFIDAEMMTLQLADELHIMPLPPTEPSRLTVGGPFAPGVPNDAANLVLRALDLVDRRAAVHLVKHIPHGGGLGGGSADAAAVLRWAGVDDPAVAASLGADVPFCVVGGQARVTGIGERVEPLAIEPRLVTLVVPPLHVSTPAVYAAWDDMGGPTGSRNDLAAAALRVEPALAEWRDRIAVLCGATPVLAGSGATWFVEGTRDNALAELVDEGVSVIVTRDG
ncbi:4-(cytidine 5'-diphospho)-2-C-methyl-D-erythritol kinase [soil metagenome]